MALFVLLKKEKDLCNRMYSSDVSYELFTLF